MSTPATLAFIATKKADVAQAYADNVRTGNADPAGQVVNYTAVLCRILQRDMSRLHMPHTFADPATYATVMAGADALLNDFGPLMKGTYCQENPLADLVVTPPRDMSINALQHVLHRMRLHQLDGYVTFLAANAPHMNPMLDNITAECLVNTPFLRLVLNVYLAICFDGDRSVSANVVELLRIMHGKFHAGRSPQPPFPLEYGVTANDAHAYMVALLERCYGPTVERYVQRFSPV